MAVGEELSNNGFKLYEKGGWLWDRKIVPTQQGQRYENVLNSPLNIQQIQPRMYYEDVYGNPQFMEVSGDIAPFNNSVEITPPPPPPQPPQPQPYGYSPIIDMPYYQRIANPENYSGRAIGSLGVNPPQQQNQNNQYLQGIVDVTKQVLQGVAHHITDGYYAAKKLYRQGRSHFAIDLRAPVGSEVKAPMSADNWTVVSTGYNSKAGNKISIATTNYKGDNIELTFAHLDSIDVKKGDTVNSGDVFARSGNTGNTTGPHLHISAKVNGKTVNPQNIDWGNPSADVQPYRQTQNNSALPQPNVEPFTPLVSSDAEFERAALDILGLNVNPLWGDISGDIASPNPYGFGGF